MAEIGDMIATYRLTGVIGGGGMGTVYRAHDERLERDVALILLAPQLSADASFRARFEREARIAGALRHPNIVPVFDAGEWNGQLYLVMMLVEGPNLATVIKRVAPLSLRRVTSIVAQIASALDAAHAQGIVHRDVKPGNILLLEHAAPDGGDHAYLADFGLTRSAGEVTQMTRAGTFLGTLDYVAPEQLQGEHVGGRADQYALACTTFEMLSATPPFRRDSEVALISAHLYAPPPLLADVRPDLPAALGSVLARAMAKDPEARFATTGAFAQALTQATFGVAVGPPTIVRPVAPTPPLQGVVHGGALPEPRESSNRPLAIAVGAVFLAVLLGGGAVLAINLAGSPSATPTPGTGVPSTQPIAAGPTAAPTDQVTVPPATLAIPTALPTTPPIPGLTLPPFPWAISVNASSTSLPVGELVTIQAVTNADIASAGYVIEISSYASGKPFNTCSSGTTCQTQGAPLQPRITTYLATVGPPGGPPVAQATTTVSWFVPPATPTPVAPPPVTAPPVDVGPTLAAGDWNVMHTLNQVVYGDPDYQPTSIPRTYSLSSYECVSDYDCTAKFVTNQNITAVYHWNGSSFHYGPRTYDEGRTCSGIGGAYTVSQEVDVTPVDWDGVSDITHLVGQMTITGTTTQTGVDAGCSDYQLLYDTDIDHF